MHDTDERPLWGSVPPLSLKVRANCSLSFRSGRLQYPASLRWVIGTAIAMLLWWSGSSAREAGGGPGRVLRGLDPGLLALGVGGAPAPPLYVADPLPSGLQKELEGKHFKVDSKSGNYLSPKVFAKTKKDDLVPVLIGGNYAKDLKGRPVFVRESIRDKLLSADAAMFKAKKEHIRINYGFRSNVLQQELFQKLSGKGKVAPPGMSFHETGMAVDLGNWQDAQKFMIEAGFVGGCYGIEEDLVHYSIDEITKASDFSAFRRCTLKEIPKHILEGAKKVGGGVKKVGGAIGGVFKKHN
jgi:hypothetical protein